MDERALLARDGEKMVQAVTARWLRLFRSSRRTAAILTHSHSPSSHRAYVNAPALKMSARRKIQNISFNPSCITRLLPDPTSGLPAATSGVAPPPPNPPEFEGLSPRLEPFAAPYGLAILG